MQVAEAFVAELATQPFALGVLSGGHIEEHEPPLSVPRARPLRLGLASAQDVQSSLSGEPVEAVVGRGEVYRTTASATARVTAIRLRLAPANAATQLVLGLYADNNGQPTTLLASGRLNTVVSDAWNEVPIDNGPTINAGTAYWIGLLNPTGSPPGSPPHFFSCKRSARRPGRVEDTCHGPSPARDR